MTSPGDLGQREASLWMLQNGFSHGHPDLPTPPIYSWPGPQTSLPYPCPHSDPAKRAWPA